MYDQDRIIEDEEEENGLIQEKQMNLMENQQMNQNPDPPEHSDPHFEH